MPEKQPRLKRRRRLITLGIAIAAGITVAHYVPRALPEISRDELMAEIRSGYVHELVITDGEVITGNSSRRGKFRVMLKRGDKMFLDELARTGVKLEYKTEPLGLI